MLNVTKRFAKNVKSINTFTRFNNIRITTLCFKYIISSNIIIIITLKDVILLCNNYHINDQIA